MPSTFGNFPQVTALLADDQPGERFSFAVVGDTKGHGTFEVIKKSLSSEPLSFMVLLGDCVRAGTPGYHSYFRAEWNEDTHIPFPVFYVVGNHDVDPQKFPISEFEKNYGPTNFSFEYQGCLFIVLRVIGQEQLMDESCRFLESQLSGRDNYRKVFVFMHKPPLVLSKSLGEGMYRPQDVLSLFDKYRVDYVIAGDYHGYARVQRKNTIYIVSGGGGAHLKEAKYGAFHHAVVITVSQDSVSERILFADRSEEIEDALERYALGELYPWMKENCLLTVVLNVVILAFCFWLLRSFIKSRPSLAPN
ncbi:MAG: hypothetical protein GWP14_06455 [Actinobacteria bacterium]|nr:hypothetical protein [Actinomycetota bacterium]